MLTDIVKVKKNKILLHAGGRLLLPSFFTLKGYTFHKLNLKYWLANGTQ
jgi:hypothetical protein